MSIFSIIGIALIGVTMSILLKKHTPEYSLGVSLITGIIILFWIVANMIPVLDKFTYFMQKTNMPSEYGSILLKSLGIAFIIQLISDTCKDVGETSTATKIELAGKIAILLISLPLFEKIISIVFDMMS